MQPLAAGDQLQPAEREVSLKALERIGRLADNMDQMFPTTEYDGCGKCYVGVRRLSRMSDATSSPERQGQHIVLAAAENGGHIIAWADDWEVSGAVNPLDRPEFGPWLRDEMGPYSGIVGADVDRIGRNQLDVLSTGYMMKTKGLTLITYGHPGPWNLDDPNDEMLFSMKALGAQIELRQIQKRNREETVRARKAGQPRQFPSYGYRYVRLVPTGKVDHVELDPVSSAVIREVKDRILADETGKITQNTECARLNRAGILSPTDHRAVLYGRQVKGGQWHPRALAQILTSEAALGYLMHNRRPVIDQNGNKIRIAPPLWDEATRLALIAKLAPKRDASNYRAPKSNRLLVQIAFCGNCGQRLYVHGNKKHQPVYVCIGRVKGLAVSAECKPSPVMTVEKLDAIVAKVFLRDYGRVPQYRQEFDPGTGHDARAAALNADRERLREDRQAGLYDDPEDAEWYRREYKRIGDELRELERTPSRPAGMYWVATGRTMGDLWNEAPDDAERRELLDEYRIRVVLYPRTHERRVWVHGLDPDTESQARHEAAERASAELDAYVEALEDANTYNSRLEDADDYIDAA